MRLLRSPVNLLALTLPLFIPCSSAVEHDQPIPDSSTLRLYHRIFHPSLPQSLFHQRASIHLAPDGRTPRLVPSASLHADLTHFADIAQSLQSDADTLYQVALERAGDADAGQWAISAVKAVSPFLSFTLRPRAHTLPLRTRGTIYPRPTLSDSRLLLPLISRPNLAIG